MKTQATRCIKVSLITIVMIVLVITSTTDNPRELGAGRKIGAVFSVPGPEGERKILCALEGIRLYSRDELPELYKIHLGAEEEPSCRANQLILKSKLEKYKQEFGFYPKEEEWWVNLFCGVTFWPYHPALRRCPEAPNIPDENLYEYRADSVPGSVVIENEHGTGYSKYELRCTNPACPEYQE